jgi:opacity protein-like surface antigen
VVAACWILAFPHLAWAVANASVTVTGADGQPLAGATVSLEGESDQVTDSRGRAEFKNVDLKGKSEESRTIRVSHAKHKDESKAVTLKEGQTVEVGFALAAAAVPAPAWTPVTPGTIAAGLVGGHIGARINPGFQVETVTFPGGMAVFEGRSPGSPRETVDINWGAAQVALGLPGAALGNLQLNPWVNGMIGGASGTFQNENKEQPQLGFDLKTDGVLYGFGFNVVLSHPNPHWFVGLGYDYRRAELSGHREPCSPPAVGLVACSSDADLTYEDHQFSSRFGYSFLNNRISPYVGVGFTATDVDAEILVKRTFSSPGGAVNVTNKGQGEFRRDRWDGIVGVAGRLGPFFAMAETRFNDRDVSALFRLLYRFDLRLFGRQ